MSSTPRSRVATARPHHVGIFVEKHDRHVDDIVSSSSVHVRAGGCAQPISLSSTGIRATDASVCGNLALSSPASTVAKTTDENL
jgi:hypothetical protein